MARECPICGTELVYDGSLARCPHHGASIGQSPVDAVPRRCAECGTEADHLATGWKIYLTSDEPPETATFCPECAGREFGKDKPPLNR